MLHQMGKAPNQIPFIIIGTELMLSRTLPVWLVPFGLPVCWGGVHPNRF